MDLIRLLTSLLSNMLGFLHTHLIILRFLKLLLDKEIVNVECWLHLEELEASFPALSAFGSICNTPQNIMTNWGFGVIFKFLSSQVKSYLEFLHGHNGQCVQCVIIFILYKRKQFERCHPNGQYTITDYIYCEKEIRIFKIILVKKALFVCY